MTGDDRILRVRRVVIADGMATSQIGAECHQDSDGKIIGNGLWFDLLVPDQEDLMAQAKANGVSTLEWLRQKLELISYLKVETYQ